MRPEKGHSQTRRIPIHWRICSVFMLICSGVTLLGGFAYYSSSRRTVVAALEESGAELCEQAAQSFVQQYAHSVEHLLSLLESSPQVDDYLMSPKDELLLRRSEVEKLFVKISQEGHFHLSVHLLDTTGREKIVTVGNRRMRAHRSLEDMVSGGPVATHLRELFLTLRQDEGKRLACTEAFRDETGRWVFLAGVTKQEPEVGGFGGAIILQHSLDPYLEMVSGLGDGHDPVVAACLLTGEIIGYAPGDPDDTDVGSSRVKPGAQSDVWTFTRKCAIFPGQPVLKIGAYVPDSLVSEQVAPVVGSALAVFLPTLLASALASLWASRWISRPIRKLTSAVGAVRSSHLHLGLPEGIVSSNNEIGDLAGAFQRMIGDLRDTTTSVETLNQEMAERREAEAQLRKAQKTLVEAAHRAGMADVATDVLHNVGNVLNSINVSTARMIDIVVHSKVASLARVAALVTDHRDQLGTFLTEDERGRQIPVFLEEVSRRLSEEQSQFAEMLDGLGKNVRHIKDTITMQQSYAKVSGMEEYVSMVEVIEDAIQINNAGLERHGVRLVRDYEDLPPVQVNKQKTLQILVNLLSNGKYAVSRKEQDDKVITIQLGAQDADTLRVDVIDNGVGIAKENLNRIFQHGFTTKTDGHGFGLHSGALAAKEMGGTLSVHSGGLGEGATFTLVLPLKKAKVITCQTTAIKTDVCS